MFLGSIVNAAAVLAGSLIGILFRKRIPATMTEIIFHALGLCTLAIGITMILKVDNILMLVFSVIIGGILGEALKMQEGVDRLGEYFKTKLQSGNKRFSEGLIGSFLIFCIGSMTIMGTIQEGLKNDHTLLLTKSILDGFAAIALGAAYGSGVFFSAFLLLIYQVLLTFLAKLLGNYFSNYMINQLIAAGGILILSIGFNLLSIKKIKTTNLLPALVVVVLFAMFFKK